MSRSFGYWKSKLWRKKLPCRTLDFNDTNSEDAISFTKVFNEEVITRNDPRRFGDTEANFIAYPETSFPALGVYTLTNALVDTGSGWVFSSNNELLVESTWYTGYPAELEGNIIRQAVFPQSIKGSVLSLVSDFSLNNYGHKLYDSFSRFYLFQQSDHSLDEVDHILLPGKFSSRWQEVAKNLGIPVIKILWAGDFDF